MGWKTRRRRCCRRIDGELEAGKFPDKPEDNRCKYLYQPGRYPGSRYLDPTPLPFLRPASLLFPAQAQARPLISPIPLLCLENTPIAIAARIASSPLYRVLFRKTPPHPARQSPSVDGVRIRSSVCSSMKFPPRCDACEAVLVLLNCVIDGLDWTLVSSLVVSR